jgi:hypothetical protein
MIEQQVEGLKNDIPQRLSTQLLTISAEISYLQTIHLEPPTNDPEMSSSSLLGKFENEMIHFFDQRSDELKLPDPENDLSLAIPMTSNEGQQRIQALSALKDDYEKEILELSKTTFSLNDNISGSYQQSKSVISTTQIDVNQVETEIGNQRLSLARLHRTLNRTYLIQQAKLKSLQEQPVVDKDSTCD